MSKDNANLRLFGSPVNLSYRSKKKDDKRIIRNRPRSALQNSCFTPDEQDSSKRPFSADAKGHPSTTRHFLKAFSAELLQSYTNSPTTIKIAPPTTDLLGQMKSLENKSTKQDKDVCSNASDYGSEDTFISLGTKIKARAQSPKTKASNQKNFLKYRNIAKRGRKFTDNATSENKKDEKNQDYGMEIKIIERTERSSSPNRNKNMFSDRSSSPFKTRPFESYAIPSQSENKTDENSLIGRLSFGSNDIQSEVEHAIDKYSRRLTLTKQQLSLVEEESTQELESVPSQNASSLSPENSLGDLKNSKEDNDEENLTGRNTYTIDTKDDYMKMSQNYMGQPKTYSSFYADFHTNATMESYKNKLSSTMIHTDVSSKDSGYHDSGTNDDKTYRQDYSLPSTSLFKKPISQIKDQPKSLDSMSTNGNEKSYKKLSEDKISTEPLNHSRLLYKDFFLKKEGHIALPPQNSPSKIDVKNIPDNNEEINADKIDGNLDYPSYLLNSTTKAYTSKVIEDYKKEIQAINNLHELTIKDIKADAISPTPFNIDKMFEQHTHMFEGKQDMQEPKTNSQESSNINDPIINSLDNTKRDISKVSTKELIQNYFKVKENDYNKDFLSKNAKKFNTENRKLSNVYLCNEESSSIKQTWNNKKTNNNKNYSTVNIKSQKNLFTTKTPLSARIEGVENDRDVDSWMSLSAPSPRIFEVDETAIGVGPVETESKTPEDKVEIEPKPPPPRSDSQEKISTVDKEIPKSKELDSSSTVLDIYSMLKEIESFGDNPVSSIKVDEPSENDNDKNKKDEDSIPKDNFMEIFEFLEKVEQSANDALSVVTSTTPQTIPKLEALLKLPQTELAQRLVTASLQLEERSCCIALLQESLANHKEQMVNKVSNLEKQSLRNIAKVKQECEEAIKRHQNFIDQLINDKKTLNHRIEQLVDERRALEERWKRSAQALEERYKLELRNQHDKMVAAQQVARQRWVRQKAEKIKELTVKGLEGELREMAERQQKEIADLKMAHAEQMGRVQAKHTQEMEDLRRRLEDEKETALVKERQMASSRLEKQILELELSYQEQRTRLVGEMRAENERAGAEVAARGRAERAALEKWKEEQEKILEEKRQRLEQDIASEREKLEERMKHKQEEMEEKFEQYKKDYESEQQVIFKKKVTEISAQHKQERDREIEKAIESMEAEAQAGRKELQEALKRNKEQYEAELRELAETEQATVRRYQEAQARVRRAEDRGAELEVTISQFETRNKVLTEKNTQLETRVEEIKASCEESWRKRIEDLKKEIDDMKKTHEEQMHQLYAKVKVAVARKDSAIQALTREAAKYQEKITLLEQKLQQQRKDFLKHK